MTQSSEMVHLGPVTIRVDDKGPTDAPVRLMIPGGDDHADVEIHLSGEIAMRLAVRLATTVSELPEHASIIANTKLSEV